MQIAHKVSLRKPKDGFDFAINPAHGLVHLLGRRDGWLRLMGSSWEKGTGYVMAAREAKRVGAKPPAGVEREA